MTFSKLASNHWLSYKTSIFSRMSQLAAQHHAINLAQGFPNFDGPEAIKEAACQAIRDGRNQYAPSFGVMELREKVAEYRWRKSQISYDPQDEVTIFSGATEALWCAFVGLCQKGDEVITFAPFYDSYRPAIESAGGILKEVELTAPDFSFDLHALVEQITPQTRLIILNHPHNPTGKVFSLRELEQIAALALKHDLWVVCDEVYEELIYKPVTYHYFASLSGMRSRSIAISSTAKTFSFTGWKVGFAFAPKEITAILRSVHQFIVFCSSTPLQYGMITAFDSPEFYYTQLVDEYHERAELLRGLLLACGQKPYFPQGSYFMLADYSACSDLPDSEFADWQTIEGKVCTIPISGFYLKPENHRAQRLVRYAFCKDLSTISEAGKNLAAFYGSSRT